MFDPATITVAVTTATSAFNAIKRAMDAGREIESISKDLNRWMGAVADVENMKKQAENPSLFRKILSGNQIEKMAFESYTGKESLRGSKTDVEKLYHVQDGNSFLGGIACRRRTFEKIKAGTNLCQTTIQKKKSSCTLPSLRLSLVAVPFFTILLMVLSCSTEVRSADHYERKTYDWRHDTKRLDNGGKTICRLARRVKNKSPGRNLQEYFCVYQGANGTTETIIVQDANHCQKKSSVTTIPQKKRGRPSKKHSKA